MQNHYTVKSREIGQIRIYMTQGERHSQTGQSSIRRFFSSVPFHVAIINAARRDGLLNATTYYSRYGFSGNGSIQAQGAEIPNAFLTMFVELLGTRDQLEQFCHAYGDLLHDKIVVYKRIEQWQIGVAPPDSNVSLEE